MLEKFRQFIKTNQLFAPTDNILLAVSGGIDSMVMLDLFIKAGYRFAIAHCNFRLRGNESDADQDFVKKFAEDRKIRFHTISFNTGSYAAERNLSIQMAARELRYNWFNDIVHEYQYRFVATGHNSDDSIETFFINLTRGTGIHGLTGISIKQDKTIRPLLFASRKYITEYATENRISFREDASNAETKYLRNKIRHHLIPLFERMAPSFRDSMIETIHNLQETEGIFNQKIEQLRKNWIQSDNEQISIDYTGIEKDENKKTILFEFLKEFGFNRDQVENVIASISSEPGRMFYSSSHRLVKDRKYFLITKTKTSEHHSFLIERNIPSISDPLRMIFNEIPIDKEFKLPKSPQTAALDIEKLTFPLILRKWQHGDKFKPLGMNNFKKVSDFFTDNKFSIPSKENTWLLLSDEEIVWIIGHRIDDRFKIRPLTKIAFVIQYLNEII